MSQRQEEASPDLSSFVSEYFWRFDLEHKLAQHVRRSDGLVVTARRMTDLELERQGGRKGKTMRDEVKKRAGALIGDKFPGSALTITALDGSHPKNGAVLVKAKCDCGQEVGKIMLSDLRRGARKYCDARTCPIALKAKGQSGAIAQNNGDGNVSTARKKAKGRKLGRRNAAPLTRHAESVPVNPPPLAQRTY